MPEPIISVSGLRGIIGSELTPMVASRYVAAYCSQLPVGKVILARDGRESGSMLAAAVSATLQAHGFRVLEAGIAATPTVGVLVRSEQAVAGIQISASHNPPQYNGLKLFNGDGRVIPGDRGRKVLEAYHANQTRWCAIEGLGYSEKIPDPHIGHEAAVQNIVSRGRIAASRFRVFLDSNHGAGSLMGHRLLEGLGCHVVLAGATPDGHFAHPPEPIAENLQEIAHQVCRGGYHVGFCQDPDADRLAVIDELGNYIGEEYTVALCLMHVLKSRKGPIVTNCATSSMAEQLAKQFDVPFFRSAVGEANVVDTMLEHRAVFGGEGNGGPIDPQVGLVRDSFVGMAIILDLMAETKKSISQLVAILPRLAIVKSKIAMSADRLQDSYDVLERKMGAKESSRQDGLRLDWPDRWLLLRGSNTEPIVRLIAEAPTAAEANQLILQATNAIAIYPALGGQ